MPSAATSVSVTSHPAPSGQLVDAFGTRCYRIDQAHTLAPFFCNVVSACDLWLFVASNGALTAGRGDADHAIFPYATVDKIYDQAGVTGPCTLVRVTHEGHDVLWQPFAAHTTQVHEITRALYKSVEGDRIWFEEPNAALGLVFRYGWATAEAHGLVRTCELVNLRPRDIPLQLADGVRNLLPPGIASRLQSESSCLADAYKTAELLPRSTFAVYSLAAGIIDRAIPMEALRATAVWSHGLPDAQVLLSDAQFETFCAGDTPSARSRVRGVRGTYALSSALTLAPRATQRWTMVIDTGLTQAEVARRF
ncbi:MAG: hypothetical protein NDI75_16305, partial [Candidatus Didemnitutus sp.]|nr:hypothetical protein [Candidatus Didemnitutus sp.]